MILDNLPITMNDLNYGDGMVLRGVDVGDIVTIGDQSAMNDTEVSSGSDEKTSKEQVRGRLRSKSQKIVRPIIYNHLVFNVLVHKVASPKKNNIYQYENYPNMVMPTSTADDRDEDTDEWYMVVGFEVMPCSIDWNVFDNVKDIPRGEKLPAIGHCRDFEHKQYVNTDVEVTYSYELFFEESDITWVSRWDAYLKMRGSQVHWFSILNSILVICFFSGIIFLILVKTVRKDLNDEVDSEAGKQDIGWKLVCGDVFRKPRNAEGFCIALGTGVQILVVSTACIFLAMLGFLSPASRGALLSTTIVFYLISSYVSAYSSVRLWIIISANNNTAPSTSANVQLMTRKWRSIAFKTGAYFFGFCYAIVVLINIVLVRTKSTAALPVYMFFVLLLLWVAIVLPLSMIGGYVASKKPSIEYPTRTNQLARQIPKQSVPPFLSVLVSGILPFGTIFIELYFIMSSIWLHEVYYVFGFLFIVQILTVIVCAEVSIVMSYIQLSTEDYRWWWRSFLGR